MVMMIPAIGGAVFPQRRAPREFEDQFETYDDFADAYAQADAKNRTNRQRRKSDTILGQAPQLAMSIDPLFVESEEDENRNQNKDQKNNYDTALPGEAYDHANLGWLVDENA